MFVIQTLTLHMISGFSPLEKLLDDNTLYFLLYNCVKIHDEKILKIQRNNAIKQKPQFYAALCFLLSPINVLRRVLHAIKQIKIDACVYSIKPNHYKCEANLLAGNYIRYQSLTL